MPDVFANRLRVLLAENNMTAAALSKACGISTSTISQYLSGKYKPKSDRISIFASYFGCSPMWLEGKDVSRNDASFGGAMLPVLDAPPASDRPTGSSGIARTEPVGQRYADGRHYFLRVSSDELCPCIESGDLVLVEMCRRVRRGELGVFAAEEGSVMLREVLDDTVGLYIGFSKCSNIKPELLTDGKLESIHIVGRVLRIIKNWNNT